ncbi:unnamed protein product [Closterium sp. Yama58-4]|nr:unnamed protein product [Closterium sp. Yama58-4]
MPGELITEPSPLCGIRPTADLLAEYIFVDVLGKGKYGVVWKCRERRTGHEFACKQIAFRALDSRALKVALREIDVLHRMRGAKHAVSLESVFGDAASLYLILELCTGGDLLSHIERKGRLPEHEARRVFASVVRAVGECHIRGIIHRDIKPENILLCPVAPSKAKPRRDPRSRNAVSAEFAPKLADFGLAIPLRADQQVVGYAGSFPYEAPEVVSRAPYDGSADVWSLGVLLFAMLTGSWPGFLEGDADRRLERAVDWRAESWAGVSARAKALITRLMAVVPEERPSAAEILDDAWFVEGDCMADEDWSRPRHGTTRKTRGTKSGCHVALTIDVGYGLQDEQGAGGAAWEEAEDRTREGESGMVGAEGWKQGDQGNAGERWTIKMNVNCVAVVPPAHHLVAYRSPRGREQCASPGRSCALMGGWGRVAAGGARQ